jgi:Family of unknown function (DUF6178)
MADSPAPLERLLRIPDLVKIVPRLQPEVLGRVIQACGLPDCAELLSLATPEQLARVLDSDLWRSGRPGADEELDPDRFGLWLTVLMQQGATVAAEKLGGLDRELLIAGLAQHIAVFDGAAVSSYTTLDGEQVPGRRMDGDLVSELGGYVIEARRSAAWEAIGDFLAFLEAERPAEFHHLMCGCVRLSNGAREEDGSSDLLDEREQAFFDLASGREAHREERGYVAPAQAGAFLREARELRLDAERPAESAIARAHLRLLESTVAANTEVAPGSEPALLQPGGGAVAQPEAEAVAALVEVLEQAGLLAIRPKAPLGGEGTSGEQAGGEQAEREQAENSDLPFVRAHAAAHPKSEQELAFLANALRAGGSIQGRPFTVKEAADCALSTCNLGLESRPSHWGECDLVTAFQVGWTILHRDIGLHAAERLIDALAGIRCRDREIQARLDGLRRALVEQAADRQPWRAREALDVILALDAPAWAGLRALIDECPALHAAVTAPEGVLTVQPNDLELISQKSQIAAADRFLAGLPSRLAGLPSRLTR